MRKLTHKYGVAAGIAALIVGVSPGIAAAEELDDLDRALGHMSADEREEFERTMLPEREIIESEAPEPDDARARVALDASTADAQTVSASSDGCWTQRWNGSGQAAAGNTLYTFFTVGRWCITNGQVTSASVADANGETSTPGWRYEGVMDTDAGVVGGQGRSYSQHQFVLGSYGIDVQSPVRCMRVNGLANATSTAVETCSIY